MVNDYQTPGGKPTIWCHSVTVAAAVRMLLPWLYAHLFNLTRVSAVTEQQQCQPMTSGREGERETCGNLHALSLSHSV